MTNDSNQYKPVSISGMVRGLTGMMSYYAFIGILLGLFAICVGGPLLVFHLLEGDDRQSQSGTHYKANKDTPQWLRPYVGSYDRHGQALDITPDGDGVYRSRTYTLCSENPQPPCEKEPGDMPVRIEFTIVQVSTGVVARSDAGDAPITLIKPGIVEYDGGTFCESDVVDRNDPAAEACGA